MVPKVVNETVHVAVVGVHGSQRQRNRRHAPGAGLGVIASDTCNIAIPSSWWG
jgi:hypothetical protein